jgi:hypothetical protein
MCKGLDGGLMDNQRIAFLIAAVLAAVTGRKIRRLSPASRRNVAGREAIWAKPASEIQTNLRLALKR